MTSALDQKGLTAASETYFAESFKKTPTEAMAAAIRAYLSTVIPAEIAEVVERLRGWAAQHMEVVALGTEDQRFIPTATTTVLREAAALNERLAASQAETRRLAVEALREAARNIVPYLEWTIGPESPGHHPTMPSAVAAFIGAFWGSREGYHRERIAALTEQEKPVAVKVDDTAWAKVRIDTEPDAHGFCFCTPYARHPDDVARDLPTEEWNGSSQFYGQVTREPSPRKEGSGDA